MLIWHTISWMSLLICHRTYVRGRVMIPYNATIVLLTTLLQQAILLKHFAKAYIKKDQLHSLGFDLWCSPHSLKLSFHIGEQVLCFVEDINMLSIRPFSNQTFTLSCSTRGFLWLRLCRIVKMHIGLTAAWPLSINKQVMIGNVCQLLRMYYFTFAVLQLKSMARIDYNRNAQCQHRNTWYCNISPVTYPGKYSPIVFSYC